MISIFFYQIIGTLNSIICKFFTKLNLFFYSKPTLITTNTNNDDFIKGKIVSWNLHNNRDIYEHTSIKDQMELLRNEKAQIYLLQEFIDEDNINITYFKEMLGMKYHIFSPNSNINNTKIGNLILSHTELTFSKSYYFNKWLFRSNSNISFIKTQIFDKEFYIGNVHLSADITSYQNRYQIKTIMNILDKFSEEGEKNDLFLIAGDFNVPTFYKTLKPLQEKYIEIKNDNYTYPSLYPIFKLDYGFANFCNVTMDILKTLKSDHYLVRLQIDSQ
jgi:endonuclease/exonuclease/phosphatase family metal-dependent hydrolase